MSEHQLDARHLLCPMPVIKVQQIIETMSHGERLRVICTDPGVRYDIPAWVKVHKHELLASNCETAEAGEDIYFLIAKVSV